MNGQALDGAIGAFPEIIRLLPGGNGCRGFGAAGADGGKIGIGGIITLRIEGNASTFVLELIGVISAPDIADGEGTFPAFEIFCLAEGNALIVIQKQIFTLGKGIYQSDLIAVQGSSVQEADEIERIF